MNILKHHQIDASKWNRCIKNAINAKPYALYEWLNIVSPKWQAVVFGDYDAVFPVPYKYYIFFKKTYQPPFTQQLGLFFNDPSHNEEIEKVIPLLKQQFRKGYIQLNDHNFHHKLKFTSRKNYILNYSDLQEESLSKSHRRNIKKGKEAQLEIQQISSDLFLKYFKKHNPAYSTEIKNHDLILGKIISDPSLEKFRILLGVFHEGQLIAGVLFLKFHNTAYHLLPFSTDEGRSFGAMHYLIFHLKTQLPSINKLDFEGSELKGVERFIKGFDAHLKPYPTLEW